MAGNSSVTGNQTITFTDNMCFDGTSRGSPMAVDGQLWIGSTLSNRANDGGHVRLGSITSPLGTVSIGYSSPNITIDTMGGSLSVDSVATQFGTTPVLPDANGLLTVSGQDGLTTVGSVNTVTMTPRGVGSANMFLGEGAGNRTLSGANNVGYGANVMPALTTGLQNTCVGTNAGLVMQGSISNTAVGASALAGSVNANNCVGIGINALLACTASNNTALGASAAATLVSGTQVTALGYNCLLFSTASSSTAIGFSAGESATTGDGNVLIGSQAAQSMLTGAQNTIIGTSSGSAYVGAESSNILIRNAGTAAESNTIRIGTQGNGAAQQNACYIAGITGVSVSNSAPVFFDTTTGQLGQGTSSAMTWTDVTGATEALAVSNGYFTNRGAGVTYTLPATAALGDTIKIDGKLGLTTIAQNANQAIRVSSSISTTGVTGTVVGTNLGDCITLRCSTAGASTIWIAENFVGNWVVT